MESDKLVYEIRKLLFSVGGNEKQQIVILHISDLIVLAIRKDWKEFSNVLNTLKREIENETNF